MQTSRQGTKAYHSENFVYDLGRFSAIKMSLHDAIRATSVQQCDVYLCASENFWNPLNLLESMQGIAMF